MRFLTRKSKRLSRKQTHALLATFTVLLEWFLITREFACSTSQWPI